MKCRPFFQITLLYMHKWTIIIDMACGNVESLTVTIIFIIEVEETLI